MTEKEESKEDDTSVRVALRIRPQLARERIDMCQVCTVVMPAEKQVMLGKDKAFTFDYVYDIPTCQQFIYTDCVEKLIEGCFEGYNATVFAYGQTGSGKTYTMGTGFDVHTPTEEIGIIPRAVDHLFKGIEERKKQALERNEPLPDFKVNAQFMELYNEEILDLLDTTRGPESRGCKSSAKIHEDASGGIYVVGITTRLVYSLQETIQCLQVGALSRATASTNMNATSSRSHAVFTLHVKQHRVVKETPLVTEEGGEGNTGGGEALNEFETLTAKFHFVDLAGSERLKRTGATGERAKEGISINCGLLALGNVISALGDKAKKGSHVPYRDSKLTRLLQDSLGGNSRTLMIACVSPSDRDFMETLNTLKYANRARNIKNKVIANQDKASKQLAILRQEIMMLQEELMAYKSGKRIIDSEGIETTSDMYHENTMLQSENDRLRSRIKTLNETIEQLTVRNTELLAERALAGLGNAAGDAQSQEVTNLIKGYVKELEELRAKLAESHLTVDRLKRTRQMSASRLAMSPMSPIHGSSMILSQSYEAPMSPDNQISSILEEAKKDVKRLKKTLKKSKAAQDGSDKENAASDEEREAEGQDHEEDDILEKDASEKSEKSEKETPENVDVNGNLEDKDEKEDEDSAEESDDDEDELPMSSSSDDDSDGKDSDNIHEDLAELTCDISIKQRLIDELEQSQKRLHAMKVQYEEKLEQLVTKIRETEKERDKVLSEIGKVETNTGEQTKKVKEQFERKLNDMQNELKKLQAAKKEHSKLVQNQSQQQKQLKTMQHELGEMKKTKVKLMKQIKEESERNKHLELKKNKEMAQLKKEQMKKDGLIRTLENQSRQKDMVLKRKQEEVEVLRKKNRSVSSRTASRTAGSSKPTTLLPPVPVSTSSPMRRRHRGAFSAKVANKKWTALEKNISAVINRKQTIANIEKDMDVWLKHREKLSKKIEKTQKKKETMIALGKPDAEIKEVSDVIDSLKNQVEFAQDNINECQTNIVQVEEAKEEAEKFDPTRLLNSVSLEEAKYLLEHFIDLSVSRGLALSAKDSEVRELMAKLHQTELNNTLQQDLLKHMMADRVDIEVDNLMTNQVDEMDSSTSSSSSSPVDSMFESRIEPSGPVARPSVMSTSSWEAAVRKDKRELERFFRRSHPQYGSARRRTTTPDELLYAGSEEQTASLLHPVPETSEAKTEGVTKIPLVMSNSAPPAATSAGSDTSLMPPPKTLPPRQTSASRLPTVSPSMRRKDYHKPSPSPSPVLRRKTSFTILPRSNSTDNATLSDTTPPSSPQPSRRIPDGNVFSRLTSNTAGIWDTSKGSRGTIVSASSKKNVSQSGPLTCTHSAEGHTKAVLSVAATEELLFTSSKDRSAKCWDLTEAREILSFTGHPNNVSVVKYSPEDHLVFTVSQSYVMVWDIRQYTSKCIITLSSSGLTQDGPVSSTTRQIDLPSGEHHINDIALTRSSKLLYSACGSIVRVWDLRRFAAVGKLSGGHQAAIMVIGVEQKEENDVVITGSKDHYLKIFEVMPEGAGVLTPKHNLEPPHYDGIQSLAVQNDILFSGSRDMCIKKWNLSTNTLVQSVNAAHKDWICAMDFERGGNTLLTGCRGGFLKLWNIDTCAQIAEIKAHTSPINSIATNSSAIFTASNDHTVRIWKKKTGSQELAAGSGDGAR